MFRLRHTPPVRLVAALAGAATLLSAGAAVAAQGASAPGVTQGVVALPTIDDSGAPAEFPLHWAATTGKAKALIVVFHGHSHNGDEWQGELATMAAKDSAVAVAPRTNEIAGTNGKGPFDAVDEEARDAASAITWARQTYGVLPTYLLCVSMGCSGLAYFLDAAVGADASVADSAWVRANNTAPIKGIVVSEGLSNLVETWGEAAAADPTSQAEIAYETGSAGGTSATPAEHPEAYRARSLALLPTVLFHTLGIKTAAVIHDVDDGLVPVNQAIETRAALNRALIPTHSYTVVGNHPSCSSTHQTTGTSYVGTYVEKYGGTSVVKDNLDPTLCLSGHATETDPKTTMMRVTFSVLHTMLTTGVGRGESVFQPRAA